ncbi:hypothetical protein BJX65DRAFT_286265 [Aspergillus insuetus]
MRNVNSKSPPTAELLPISSNNTPTRHQLPQPRKDPKDWIESLREVRNHLQSQVGKKIKKTKKKWDEPGLNRRFQTSASPIWFEPARGVAESGKWRDQRKRRTKGYSSVGPINFTVRCWLQPSFSLSGAPTFQRYIIGHSEIVEVNSGACSPLIFLPNICPDSELICNSA